MVAAEVWYPSHNPFPAQGTASVETTGGSPGSAIASVLTPQLRHASVQVEAYLRLRTQVDADAAVLAFYGPAGSGKTHTLRELLSEAKEFAEKAAPPAVIGTAYVLVGAPDLDALRYGVLKQIPLETLKHVTSRFLQIVGREYIESDVPAPRTKEGQEQRSRLRDNLAQVEELIKSALLTPSQFEDRRSQELRQAGSDDFRNAVSYIDDAELGAKARDWLCGEPLDEETLRRLGVGKVRSSDHAHQALRVVVRLFQRTGTPLLIFLDQCENLLRPDPRALVIPESVRFLQGLLELLPKEKALLAVAMNDDVWKQLQAYLRQRFGLATYRFSILSEQEARDFAHTFVRGLPPKEGEIPDPYPFTDDGIKEILAGIRGNLRGFLQVSHVAFRLALPSRQSIDGPIVRRALEEAQRSAPSLEFVTGRIGHLLRDRGLVTAPPEAAPTLSRRVTQTIEDRAGRALARLEISESLFIDDEARQGLLTVEAVQRSLQDPRQLPMVVVVVGYASPEILAQLTEATPHVLVYEPEEFSGHFLEVIDGLRTADAARPQESSVDLQTVRAEVGRLLQARTEQSQGTQAGAIELLDRQEANRIQDLWRTARANWPKERKEIEEKVKAAREKRQQEELTALEWERNLAWKERRQGTALFLGTLAVIGLALVAYRYLLTPIDFRDRYLTEHVLGAFAAAGVPFLLFVLHLYAFPGTMRALWSPVRSIDELEQLAARYARAYTSSRGDLASNNPQIRYAAIRALGNSAPPSVFQRLLAIYGYRRPALREDVGRAIRSESNFTVRRAIAQSTSPDIGELPNWPERLYRRDKDGVVGVIESLPKASIALIHDVLFEKPSLSRAYGKGITQENWPELELRASVPLIQSVLRDLSPFEHPGLGTFNYLKSGPEVDSLYLFFRQWLYYIELDLPVSR